MKELRPFQQESLEQLREGMRARHVRQILVLPTGSGKTVVAAHMISNAKARGNKTLMICDRITLINQTAERMLEEGFRVSVIQADNPIYDPDPDVYVASIQTLRRRTWPSDLKLIIIDEVHIFHTSHVEMLEKWNAIYAVGLTATPEREALGKYFTRMVEPTSAAALTAAGWLVPIKAYGPSEPDLAAVRVAAGDYNRKDLGKVMEAPKIIGDIVREWLRCAQGRRTLCFAVNIAHSKAIVEAFKASGIPAEHMDCHTDSEERQESIARFRSGETLVLSSVAVLAVGFDVPDASCVIQARPTKSITMHIQQIGRGARPAEGKSDCILLDHAGNVARLGFFEDYQPTGLKDGEYKTGKSQAKERLASPCPSCGCLRKPGEHACPECGFAPERQNAIETVDGDLEPLERPKVEPESWYRQAVGAVVRLNGKNPRGEAAHAYKAKFDRWPARHWKDMEPQPPSGEVSGYIKHRRIKHHKSPKQQRK